MAVVQGLIDTEDIEVDSSLELPKKLDVSDRFTMLQDDETQFMTAITKLSSREAVRERVNWGEDDYLPRLSATAASATSAATTIDVTTGHGVYFAAGDIVRNAASGEAFRVSSISTDALTVVRGIGSGSMAGVTAASAQTGEQLVIIGNASAQGATLPTRRMMMPTFNYNYTQIIRNSAGFTGTEEAIAHYGGSPSTREERKKFVEHKRMWESTFFFGARSYTTSGSTPLGTAGGLVEFIQTNVFNPAGALTTVLLENYLRQSYQYGSRNKVLFVSPILAQHISGYLKTAWTAGATPVNAKAKVFGTQVDGYIDGTYGRQIPVIVKQEWGTMSVSRTQYGGWGFIVDMDMVAWRPLRGRNTALLRNRQANDADESTFEYRTEGTFEIRHEAAHAVIKGVTTPS